MQEVKLKSEFDENKQKFQSDGTIFLCNLMN